MKINKKIDTRALKGKHRLELVMQETGQRFEIDAADPNRWRSVTKEYGLLVIDLREQKYTRTLPGMNPETGDVFAWLQLRYNFTFVMAVNYLQARAPDPIQEARLIKVKKNKQLQPQENDYVIISNEHINPATGARSYAVNYRYDLMDKDQQAALDLVPGEWVIKYFNKSSRELWNVMDKYPHRFRPIIDFEIDKCAQCEARFNWQDAQTVAYAQETQRWITVTAENNDQTLEVSGQLTADDVPVDELFIDDDFVICEKCRAKKHTHYKALALVRRSARKREDAAAEEQKQFERERTREAQHEREREEERMNIENFMRDSAAAGEREEA